MRMSEGMLRRSLFIVFVAALTACSTSQPATQERPSPGSMSYVKIGNYSSDSGSDPVGVIPEAKIGNVTASIEYPIKAGSYPLIVFERPAGASPRNYESIASYWTSYGYVCIRTPDVKLVLDSLDELEKKYPELKGKIDRTKIGVAGHVANMATIDPADPRVRAALVMSPEKAEDVKKPVMVMTGSDLKTNEPLAGRREAFNVLTPGDKYFVAIQGARETSFGGGFNEQQIERETRAQPVYNPNDPYAQQRGMPPPGSRSNTFERERRVIADIRIVSMAFWDAYLKGNSEGMEFLKSAHMNEGLIKTETK